MQSQPPTYAQAYFKPLAAFIQDPNDPCMQLPKAKGRTDAWRVVYLLDQSGSMDPTRDGGYSKSLRSLLDSHIKSRTDVEHHCIVFSREAEGGRTFASLPILCSSTDIEKGLRAFISHLVECPTDRVILVFISDGEDDYPLTIDERIRRLPALPVQTCHIVSVAVGRAFPTTMAIELRNKFQTRSDEADALPFVIEMEPSLAGAELAAVRVQQFVEEVVHPRKPLALCDIQAGTPIADIIRMCEDCYRKCAIRCLDPSYKASSPAELVQRALNCITAVELSVKAFMEPEANTSKPLPSALLRRRHLGVFHDFRAKLNELRARSVARFARDSLSDDKKRELLGFNVTYDPKRYATALAIRPADHQATLRAMADLLKVYAGPVDPSIPNPYDAVGLVTQNEILADAAACQGVLSELEATQTIAGVLKIIPLVGRLCRRKMPPNLLNPYCQRVELDGTMRFVSTDAIYTSKGSLQGNDTLILAGGHPSGLPFFVNSQSFLLLDNPDCSHADSLIAGAYLWLEALLTADGSPLPSWAREELAMVERLVDTQTSAWWKKYVDHVAGEDFSQCLVTESADFGDRKYLRCPHPGKFLVALWYGIAKGVVYTEEQLRRRLFAMAVELLGRESGAWRTVDLFTVEGMEVEPYFEAAWKFTQCRTPPYTCKEKLMSVVSKDARWFIKDKLTSVVSKDARGYIKPACANLKLGFDVEAAKAVKHYGITIRTLELAFTRLAEKSGFAMELSPNETAAAAAIAANPSSMERCVQAGAWRGAGAALSLEKDLEHVVVSNFLGKVELKARAFWTLEYDRLLIESHEGVPLTISKDFLARYEGETGRDVARDFEVDPLTGLSGNACCYPKCLWYLVRAPKGKNGTVKNHLKEALGDYVPGLHQCVAQDKDADLEATMAKIEQGLCLKEPRLSKKDKQLARRTGRDEKDLRGEKLAGMREGIRALLDRMAPEFLECAVRDVALAYQSEDRTYEEFKADFDRAYANAPCP